MRVRRAVRISLAPGWATERLSHSLDPKQTLSDRWQTSVVQPPSTAVASKQGAGDLGRKVVLC